MKSIQETRYQILFARYSVIHYHITEQTNVNEISKHTKTYLIFHTNYQF